MSKKELLKFLYNLLNDAMLADFKINIYNVYYGESDWGFDYIPCEIVGVEDNYIIAKDNDDEFDIPIVEFIELINKLDCDIVKFKLNHNNKDIFFTINEKDPIVDIGYSDKCISLNVKMLV